jgi:hypothetical protein
MRDKTQFLFLLAVVLAVAGWLFAGDTLGQPNLTVAPAQSNGRRVARVIGNAAYPGVGTLRNSANDASAAIPRGGVLMCSIGSDGAASF